MDGNSGAGVYNSAFYGRSKNVLPASGSVEKKVILIDAGHGGDDPGKIGINQAKEKDINLAIAKKLKVCLEKAGFEVAMTRGGGTKV